MEQSKGSILIVDDERLILQVLTRILQRQGYSVSTAENGRSAVEKIKTNLYDLIMIDLKLPDINGIDLLRLVNAARPEMKKIILTGDLLTEDKIKELKNEADSVLVKPCGSEELIKTINDLLKW